MTSRFTTPALRPVDRAEYVARAQEFIAQIAPSLREDIRAALAIEVTEQLLGLRPRHGFGDLQAPILQLNRSWLWPELAERFPFRLPLPRGYSLGQLWGGEHSTAFYKADQLKRELTDSNFKRWVHWQPMPTIREWRNLYIPDLPKRTSKYFTVFALFANPGFCSGVPNEYRQWRASVADEIALLTSHAQQTPVPRHLEWLAWLVTHRLDAHYSYFNSTTGPQAFDARLAAIVAAAGQAGTSKPEITIGPIASYLTMVFGGEVQSLALDVVKGFTNKLSDLLRTPARLSKHFKPYRPNEFSPSYVCEECSQSGSHKRLPGEKSRLAPFHFLCRCRNFSWKVKSQNFDFPSGYDQQHMGAVQLWLAESLVGLPVGEFPVVALFSYTQSLKSEQDWQEKRRLSCG